MFKRVVTIAAVASFAFAGTTFAAPEVGPVVKHVVTSHIDANGVDIIDPDFGTEFVNVDLDLIDHFGPMAGERVGGDVFHPMPTPQEIVKAIIFNKIETAHGRMGDSNHPIPDIFTPEDVAIPTFVWIEALIEALDPYIDREADPNGDTLGDGAVDGRAIKVIKAVRTYMNQDDAPLGSNGPQGREAFEPELDPRTQFCVNRSISQAEASLAECQATNGDLCYKASAELLFEDMSGCFSAPAP